MKRVLVTGASGFVGANLARRLLRDGHETHLLLRPSHQSWRFQEIVRAVRVHQADLVDGGTVRRLLEARRPDWGFQLAASAAPPRQTAFQHIRITHWLL